jgi:hypothetical protein
MGLQSVKQQVDAVLPATANIQVRGKSILVRPFILEIQFSLGKGEKK